MSRLRETLPERFAAKVDRSGECWLWTASFTKWGYGQIVVERGKPKHAHRVALMLAGVDVPPRAQVHHKCEVRACVNPDHLEVLPTVRAHMDKHLRGCAQHGESEMKRTRSGKNAGMRYCGACSREKARARYWAKKRSRELM